METKRISIYDIMNIGEGGSLSVTLPSYVATVSVRNLVSYVRNAYPREDGKTYATTTDKKTNTITISVVDEMTRRKKSSTQTDGDN